MFDRYVAQFHDFTKKYKKHVLWSVLFLTAAAGIGLIFIKFEGNIDLMLPDDKEIHRSISFLRDSNLSDKVIVSLSLTSRDKDKKDLFYAADQLAASLTPPLFSKITAGFSIQDAIGDISLVNYAPQVLGEKELLAIDSQINTAGVSEKMQRIYRQSLRPESIFMMSIARSDPMGISMLLLNKFSALTSSMGYEVNIEEGHFISRDGRHTMLIIQTPVSMTDGPGCKRLVEALKGRIGLLPGYISASIISGHLHTVSNEKVIKRDIQLASVISSIAFLILFIVAFRDARVILVFTIPIAAVILSINLSNLLIGNLSYLVIGMGTVIAGISIDYGLHVYIALRKGVDAYQTVKLSKLLFIDALTTVGGFFTLFFSQVKGYHQLAFFSILCIIFSLAFALFILPLLLSWVRHSPASILGAENGYKNCLWYRKSHLVLWGLLTLAALFFSFNVKIDSDITRLDGREKEVLQAEENFNRVWGKEGKQAIFVVAEKEYEKAMETNDRIYEEAVQALGAQQISSLAMIWFSERTRKENIERWNRFWKGEREEKLKRLIKEQSGKYQFSEAAFYPFFDNLYKGTGAQGEFLSKIRERFIQKKNDEYRIMSFFPDEKKYIEKMSAISKKYPGTFIVSRKALSKSISDFTSGEMKYLIPIAVILNIILTFLFFMSVKETLIALVPVATSLIWLFGLMSLLNLTLNVMNIIAGIIVTGLVVDFGIGMVYEYRYSLKIGTVIAITLSAATTLIGAGVLIFAEHPVLFSIGVSMVISVLSGYLSSVFVVPSLCDMLLAKRLQRV